MLEKESLIESVAIPTETVTTVTESVTMPTETVTIVTEPVTTVTEPLTMPTEPVTMSTEPVTMERFRWSKVLNLVLVLLSSILYCTSIALIKDQHNLSSYEICTIQSVLTILTISLWVTHQNVSLRVDCKLAGVFCVTCVSGAAGFIITVYSVQHIRFGDAILLLYTAPFFAGLFSKLTFQEPCGVVNFTSGFACFIGSIFILQPGIIFSDLAHSVSVGECGVAVLGALCLGVCYTSVRLQYGKVPLVTTLFWINVILVPVTVAGQLVTSTPYTAPGCGAARGLLLVSGLMLSGSVLLLFTALSRDVTTPVVLFRNTDILLGYLYQRVWFHEEVDVLNIIGLVMVGGAVSAVFLHKLCKNVTFRTQTPYNVLNNELGDLDKQTSEF